MIKLETIEKVVAEVAENVDLSILDFVQSQKEFSGYLLGEDFHLLTEGEKETLLFVHMVLHKSIAIEREEITFDAEEFQAIEDQNWEVFNEKGKTWEEKLDKVFKTYPEEELLAFAEDMVNDDEISVLAKELIFVTAKSYIEVFD